MTHSRYDYDRINHAAGTVNGEKFFIIAGFSTREEFIKEAEQKNMPQLQREAVLRTLCQVEGCPQCKDTVWTQAKPGEELITMIMPGQLVKV